MPARTPLEPTSRAHATLGLARAETRREKLGRIRAGFEEHPRCESRKTACEPAPPTPSTHANVQTSKVSSRPWGPLTNFSCRSHTGNTLCERLTLVRSVPSFACLFLRVNAPPLLPSRGCELSDLLGRRFWRFSISGSGSSLSSRRPPPRPPRHGRTTVHRRSGAHLQGFSSSLRLVPTSHYTLP